MITHTTSAQQTKKHVISTFTFKLFWILLLELEFHSLVFLCEIIKVHSGNDFRQIIGWGLNRSKVERKCSITEIPFNKQLYYNNILKLTMFDLPIKYWGSNLNPDSLRPEKRFSLVSMLSQALNGLSTLHYTTPHYTTPHYTTPHYTTLYYTTLHYTTLHNTTQHCTALHCTALHYTTSHYTTLHYTTLN